MITPGINRFVATLLYPITDSSLVFHDDIEEFFQKIPDGFIDHKTSEQLHRLKRKIRKTMVEYITKRYQIDSFDQIYQYLDRWYLSSVNWREIHSDGIVYKTNLSDLIFRRLYQLSKSMVSKLDGQIIYKYWQTEGDAELLGGFVGQQKIHLFRSMMQKIPMDIMVAFFALDKQEHAEDILNSYRGSLAVTDASLEKILVKGVSENHIHTGASTNFSIMWEEMMCVDQVMSDPLNNWMPKIERPNVPSQKIIYFDYLLARCFRLLLICFVSKQNHFSYPHHLKILKQTSLQLCYQKILADEMDKAQMKEYFYPLEYELVELILSSDFLKREWISSSERPFTEVHFLYQTLNGFGRQETAESCCIKKYFWNYLRLKHSIFQWITQDKTTKGLDHFQTHYRAVSSNRLPKKRNMELHYERLIDAQLKTPHIRCVEFRMSFFESESDAISNIRAFLTAYRTILHRNYCIYDHQLHLYRPSKILPRIGIIFNFLKKEQAQPDLCYFVEDSNLMAYYRLHDKYRIQLEIFKKLRDVSSYPGIDRYLIGIDVASLENTVPTWVFSDLYDCARDSQMEAYHSCRSRPFQSLRFTCHAGEDFRHLMSGLRRVYEVVQYLKFHTGDRIGHGLALGLNVEQWCQEHPNVILPRIEALENYIWAYMILSEYPSQSKGGDLLYLEKRIHTLCSEIYFPEDEDKLCEQYIPTDILLKSYCKLFSKGIYDSDIICKRQCDNQETCILQDKEKINGVNFILQSYHCHKYVMYMNQPIHYQILPQEVSILKNLQEIMQTFISQTGIVVETNPTSNIIISNIDTIKEHPIYQLSKNHCDYKDMMLCINSDDPGVFQTNTSNELGIVYMGMVEQGKGRNYCLDWIDKMRESGMQHTFIYQNDEDEALLKELDELLEALA